MPYLLFGKEYQTVTNFVAWCGETGILSENSIRLRLIWRRQLSIPRRRYGRGFLPKGQNIRLLTNLVIFGGRITARWCLGDVILSLFCYLRTFLFRFCNLKPLFTISEPNFPSAAGVQYNVSNNELWLHASETLHWSLKRPLNLNGSYTELNFTGHFASCSRLTQLIIWCPYVEMMP